MDPQPGCLTLLLGPLSPWSCSAAPPRGGMPPLGSSPGTSPSECEERNWRSFLSPGRPRDRPSSLHLGLPWPNFTAATAEAGCVLVGETRSSRWWRNYGALVWTALDWRARPVMWCSSHVCWVARRSNHSRLIAGTITGRVC